MPTKDNPPRHWTTDELEGLMVDYLDGASFDTLGATFGVTRERIRQLLRPNREQVAQSAAARKAKRLATIAEREDEIRSYFDAGVQPNEAARALDGITVNVVRGYYSRFIRELPPLEQRRRHAKPMEKFSPEFCLDVLRRSAERDGTPGIGLVRYERGREDGWPSGQTITKRFGSWRAACEAAGLQVNSRPASDAMGARWFTDEQYIDALVYVRDVTGKLPAAATYDDIRRPTDPTQAAVRIHFGGDWMRALEALEALEAHNPTKETEA
jgi:predicted DNA-binding protein (UPF0251 family)